MRAICWRGRRATYRLRLQPQRELLHAQTPQQRHQQRRRLLRGRAHLAAEVEAAQLGEDAVEEGLLALLDGVFRELLHGRGEQVLRRRAPGAAAVRPRCRTGRRW